MIKRFHLVLLVTLLILSCNKPIQHQSDTSQLEFLAKLKGTYSQIASNDSSVFMIVEFSLVNKSNKPFSFIAYSCTTASLIVTDSKLVEAVPNDCSANSLSIYTLMPLQEFNTNQICKKEYSAFGNDTGTRFGMILLNPDSIKETDYFEIHDLICKMKDAFEDVIWSKPIHLNIAYGHPSEIRNSCDSINQIND